MGNWSFHKGPNIFDTNDALLNAKEIEMKKYFFMMLLLPVMLMANTVKVEVPGMVCQMCVQGMKKNFKEVVKDANKDVQVDLDSKVVTLNLSKEISDDEIKERVKNAGYNAKKITRIKE